MPLSKSIEKRYFSITEVAEQLELSASQLRYWEKEFTVLKPRTNARGKRFYSVDDVEVVRQIAWLVKAQGYTIEGARKAMKKRQDVATAMTADLSAPELDSAALLSRLRLIREQLVDWERRLR